MSGFTAWFFLAIRLIWKTFWQQKMCQNDFIPVNLFSKLKKWHSCYVWVWRCFRYCSYLRRITDIFFVSVCGLLPRNPRMKPSPTLPRDTGSGSMVNWTTWPHSSPSSQTFCPSWTGWASCGWPWLSSGPKPTSKSPCPEKKTSLLMGLTEETSSLTTTTY